MVGDNFTNANVLYVDTFVPSKPVFSYPANHTYYSDLIPMINWTTSNDTNFRSYTLQASTTLAFTDIIRRITLDGNQSINQSVADLDFSNVTNNGSLADYHIFVRLNVSDEADQWNLSSVFKYNLKWSCSILEAGEYSYCTIIRQTNTTNSLVSMAQIGRETGATYVYKWLANHTWQTHTVGSTVNQYENFSRGDVAVLWVATADGNQTWDGQRIWDISNITHGTIFFNFTNITTESKWNLVPWTNLSDVTFAEVQTSLNWSAPGTYNETGDGNFTYFSYPNPNGTGLRYLGYIWNKNHHL